MPEISRFYGIVIQMYHHDHAPPHFHAIHGGDGAVIAIDSLAVLHGYLRPRALRLVKEWAGEHDVAIRRAWEATQAGIPPEPIDPLL